MAWLNVAEKAETAGFDVLAYWDEMDGVDQITRISVTPVSSNREAGGAAITKAAAVVLSAYGSNKSIEDFFPEFGELPAETVYLLKRA